MVDGKQVVALIPARSGSKRLPGKNMLQIGGYPLVAWTIRAAVSSRLVDQVLVSSDSLDVLALADELGAIPLDRPSELAADSSLASEVMRHAMEGRDDFDILVYLQPTSPLRRADHIDEALTLLAETSAQAVVSVYKARSRPDLMYRVTFQGRLAPLITRGKLHQRDNPGIYVLNGAIYAADIPTLATSGYDFSTMDLTPYVMSEEDSVDIDDRHDFNVAERILRGIDRLHDNLSD